MKSRLATYMNLGGRILVSTLNRSEDVKGNVI